MATEDKHENFIGEGKIGSSSVLLDFPKNSPLMDPLLQPLNLEIEQVTIDPLVNSTPKTTVIIPTLNEENNIKIIINELQRLGYSNILVIDGNSDDATVEVAKSLDVNVLNQDGKGKGSALRQAFTYGALGDWVIMMDADGSMDPKEIPVLLSLLRNGADVAKASRFMKGGHSDDMTFIRRLGNRFFVFLVNRMLKAKYTDLCYGYAAFTKEALQKLTPHLKSTSFEIETEIFMKAKILGLNIEETPSIELCRINGKTNLSAARDGFKILQTILRESYHKRNYGITKSNMIS